MSGWTTQSETIAQQFSSAGFAVANDVVDADGLARLKPIYEGFLDGSIPCPTTHRKLGGLTTHIIAPHLYSQDLSDHPVVESTREIARAIQQTDEPQLVFSAIFHKPAGHPHATPWHQDMAYAGTPTFPAGATVPNNCVVTFWIAIEDVTQDMGCMEFIPGVQDQPMPEHCVFSGEPMAGDRLLAIVDAEHRLPLESAVKCPLRAGSASIHGYGTPHYTAPNRSGSGRKSLVLSYNHPDTVRIVGGILAARNHHA